jgi:TetR/AcrR family transcriptional repressor of nem operon
MKKTMGRPRAFHPQDFLNTALDVFWLKGFQATSMADLMKTSGLASASIYKLYPDKKSLFLAALTQYMEDGLRRMAARANELPPGEALRETLDYCAHLSSGENGIRGCLTIAAANELIPGDKEVCEKVHFMFNGIKQHLEHIIRRGQEEDIFRTDTAASVIAESLFMLLEGMRVYGKIGPEIADLKQVNHFMMTAILKPKPTGGDV